MAEKAREIDRDVTNCIGAIMACTDAVFTVVLRLQEVDRSAALALGRLAAAIELATLDWTDRQSHTLASGEARLRRRLH